MIRMMMIGLMCGLVACVCPSIAMADAESDATYAKEACETAAPYADTARTDYLTAQSSRQFAVNQLATARASAVANLVALQYNEYEIASLLYFGDAHRDAAMGSMDLCNSTYDDIFDAITNTTTGADYRYNEGNYYYAQHVWTTAKYKYQYAAAVYEDAIQAFADLMDVLDLIDGFASSASEEYSYYTTYSVPAGEGG